MEDKIYVLHEYGSDSHYNGLKYLCDQKNVKLIFREFRFVHMFGSGIVHKDYKRILKQPINALFLLSLLFTHNRTIVLGMHPFDKRLTILRFLLRNHNVYYHTSFTMWNPKETIKYKDFSQKDYDLLEDFLKTDVRHIFAVSTKTKRSIIDNLSLSEEKITVVYHSYLEELNKQSSVDFNSFIYVGRMDASKGIEEICAYFIQHPELKLTLIGTGDDVSYVKLQASQHSNIQYLGFKKGLVNLKTYYQRNAFFILNSKKTSGWEELFGQVLFEAMSCGCIPIAVKHSGPKEIIEDNKNGYLFDEGDLHKKLDEIVNATSKEIFYNLREEAFVRGHFFESQKISTLWEKIFN